jgi:tetratricopeptide (TPR) repeat protein
LLSFLLYFDPAPAPSALPRAISRDVKATGRRAGRVWVGFAIAVALGGPGKIAAAAPDDSAGVHHQLGRAAIVRGQYEEAIVEYRRAYELKADPSYLYDIAEAYRALGVADRAVFFYRRYLSTHPRPPNRPEVEAVIARLDPPPPLRLTPTPGAMPVMVPVAASASAHPVSEQERSVVGTWWFWTAVGALAAASATVAIFVAAQESQGGSDIPATRLGNARIEF